MRINHQVRVFDMVNIGILTRHNLQPKIQRLRTAKPDIWRRARRPSRTGLVGSESEAGRPCGYGA